MDEALNVSAPSFVFQGFLVVVSVVLWIAGTLYVLLGATMFHVLDLLFVDGYGLKEGGAIAFISIGVGSGLILTSFLINLVVLFPTALRYGLLALLFMMMIVFCVGFAANGVHYTPRLNALVKFGIRHAMKNYNAGHPINVQLNAMHQNLMCCGTKNYTSWFHTPWASGKRRVPASCCKDLDYCHNLEPIIMPDIFVAGCYRKIDIYAEVVGVAFTGTSYGIIAIQVLGIGTALLLAVRHKNLADLQLAGPLL